MKPEPSHIIQLKTYVVVIAILLLPSVVSAQADSVKVTYSQEKAERRLDGIRLAGGANAMNGGTVSQKSLLKVGMAPVDISTIYISYEQKITPAFSVNVELMNRLFDSFQQTFTGELAGNAAYLLNDGLRKGTNSSRFDFAKGYENTKFRIDNALNISMRYYYHKKKRIARQTEVDNPFGNYFAITLNDVLVRQYSRWLQAVDLGVYWGIQKRIMSDWSFDVALGVIPFREISRSDEGIQRSFFDIKATFSFTF